MSARAERHAWHRFREVMSRRQAEFDGQVPIALVVASVCHDDRAHRHDGDDEAVDVDLDGELRVLRPPGTTPEMVAELLERLAAQIRAGDVR